MDTPNVPLVPEPFGPLQGVKILSTGTLVAQPFAAHVAAAFGAQVIQVEHPNGATDPWRRLDDRMQGEGPVEVATCFVQERRNAFYVTLDLCTPEGRDLFLRFIAMSGIWMESSKPGTWAKWGLSDDVVLTRNPAVVITHVSGYGQEGHPDYLGRASYDMIGQAFGGLMNLTGFPDPEPPVRAVPYTGDYISALFALWSSLAAYIYAQRSGKGQVVDVAQFEAVHQILGGTMVQYFNNGVVRERSGNKSPTFQPYDTFRARDGWIVLGALGPIFERTCRVVGLDAEKYAEAATNIDSERGRQFDNHLRGWIGTRSVAEAVRAFNEGRIPCSPVMTSADMAADPHYRARGVHTEWDDHPGGGAQHHVREELLRRLGRIGLHH